MSQVSLGGEEQVVLQRAPEGPERAEHAFGDVAYASRGVTSHGLPMRPVVGRAPEDHFLHEPAALDEEPVCAEEALVGRGRPGEIAGHESRERIRSVLGLVAERLEEREEELLSGVGAPIGEPGRDRKSTRLNSSHSQISYAVFCLKKK